LLPPFSGRYCSLLFGLEIMSTLNVKATGSSEMTVNIYQTTRTHIPEHIIFIVTTERISDLKSSIGPYLEKMKFSLPLNIVFLICKE
jgi:hypothetical protein